jgi:polyisoprenoid-binding protein YceI
MIGSTLCLALVLQQAVSPASPTRLHEYTVDAGHSIVEFSVGFALTHVKGRFTNWNGTILYDSITPGNSSITAILETKSLDTGWPHRDQHLRTSDFFDVEHFPTITFQSTTLRRAGDSWIADGTLTMHGVSKPVSLPFRFLPSSPSRSPESGNMTLNLEGRLRLARADFGIAGGSTYNSWFTKARAATVADSVDIAFEVEAFRADAASLRSASIVAVLDRIATLGVDSQVTRLRALKARTDSAHWDGIIRGYDFVVRALVLSGKRTDAVALASALAESFSRFTDAQLVLGFAADAAGDRAKADAAYGRAKSVYTPPRRDPNEQFPQVDESWYYADLLARMSLEGGLTSAALGLSGTVAEIYPGVARAHSRYGEALALVGRTADAEAAFRKALERDPMETRALEYRRRLVSTQRR